MIYLDNNATTAVAPEVLEAMRPYFLAPGNTESRHAAGRAARRAWESAREAVAGILGADPSEVIFTSGGTEANQRAVSGLAGEKRGGTPGHVISSPVEHPAVANPVDRLEARGFAVDRPPVDARGRADAAAMAALIRDDTRFLALMLANNETGAVQPVAELAALAAARGVPVHTDAVQAAGRIAVDFRALGVATLAVSAHKFHGPAGVGVLVARAGLKLPPRPGTAAVALAVGMARALELWRDEADERLGRWVRLCERLESGLVAALGADRVVRNGPIGPPERLPQTLNLGFPGLDGDALLMQLDLAGVCASLGSACASGSTRPSPTLLAMNVPADRLRSSVRFSLGASTTEAEIDAAVGLVAGVVGRMIGRRQEGG